MDTKFHHCRGTHCLSHHNLNKMCELWATVASHLQGHSDHSVGEKPHSKRSHLQSVNQYIFGSVLDIFHLSGCAQPMTTLHTPSIPPKGTACTLLTKEGQVPVSIPPVWVNPNPISSQSCHMYLPPTLYTVIPVIPVLHHVAVLLPPTTTKHANSYQRCQSSVSSLSTPWLCANTITTSYDVYWLNFWSHMQYCLKDNWWSLLNKKITHFLEITFWHY